MTSVTDADLAMHIGRVLQTVDPEKTMLKQFIQLLEKELGSGTNGSTVHAHLKSRKEFIKSTLVGAIHAMQSDDEDSAVSSSSSSSSSDDDDGGFSDEGDKPRKSKTKKKVGGGGGLSAKKEISDDLANFLGQGKSMARTEIVKSLWEYIRDNNLQNPSNKREILLDDKMKAVFGCDVFTIFSMNKYISAHVHPFKPVDLTTPSTPKSATKKRKSKAVTDSSQKSKKRKVGSQPPYWLSDALADIVGCSALPRPQVTSKLWDYIKSNNLQNPNDKREIICDSKLQAVMKRSKVTMFNMNKFITPHILEKVDKADAVKYGGAQSISD